MTYKFAMIFLFLMSISTVFTQPPPPSSINLFPIKDYLIDEQHSYIGFKIKYFGFSPVRGRFNEFKGHLLYDEKDISKTVVHLFIDVNSINTGVEMRDNDLKTEYWFDTEQFPSLSFQSKKVMPTTTGFQVIGDFTMKGITKEITLDFEPPTALSKDYSGNDQVDFSGKTTIKRSDYDMMAAGFWSSLMDSGLKQLSDEVEIEVDIHCRRPDYLIRKRDLEADNVRKLVLDEFNNKGEEAGFKLLEHFHATGTKVAKTKLSAGALSTIAYIFLAEGKTDMALAVVEKKAAWFPESKTTAVDLAKVYAAMGHQAKTEHYLKAALEKDSQNTRAMVLWKQLGE